MAPHHASCIAFLLFAGTAAAQPANNTPCTAATLPINVGTCTYSTFTNVNATASAVADPIGCGGYQGGDVWFQFTVPANGNLSVRTATSSGSSLTDGVMAFYTATDCSDPATFTEIACHDDVSWSNRMPRLTLNCLDPGSTIYVRFWEYGNNAFGNFRICAFRANFVTPDNQHPCGATTLAVNTTCVNTSGTNANACPTGWVPNPGCANFNNNSRDVWYTFTAPPSGLVAIGTTAGGLTNAGLALYQSNDCNSAFTLLDCDNNSGPGNMPFINRAGLVPGGTYFLRVWGNGTSSGTFSICLRSPAMPVGADCVYSLEMFDSAHNGWGSSSVGIRINGGAWTDHTVTASYNAVLIGLSIGDVLQVRYVATGPNQNQNSYVIRQVPGGQGIHIAGPNPPSGTVITTVVDCIPPMAPPEDCNGGSTICGNQSFNSNAQGTGFQNDLNASNFGCLSNGERQGTWYHFSPSTGGTVGMTISPTDPNDDYDFAVWGPGPAVTCAPAGPPTRCSYAAPTGDTGMGNGATDHSEGAGGDKWVAPLDVLAGEVYTLYVSNWSQSGLSFNLSWDLSNGASLDCTVLPAELLTLQADALLDAVQLRWSTASESATSHWHVHRSTDGKHFETIGRVNARGDSQQLTDYHFADRAPLAGYNYYRVELVDIDGMTTLSDVVHVFFRDIAQGLVVFPNPAGERLHAEVILPHDGDLDLRLTDTQGRLVRREQRSQRRGEQRLTIDLRGLDPGPYQLLVAYRNGEHLGTARFIVQ